MVEILGTMLVASWVGLVALWAGNRRQRQREAEQTLAQHNEELRRLTTAHEAQIARLRRESEERLRFAHHPVILDLLSAMDALDVALEHARGEGMHSLAKGLEMVHEQWSRGLARHGVERVWPEVGASFDPVTHEAVQVTVDADLPAGAVRTCLRAGFVHEDRILRAAMVEVAKALESAIAENPHGEFPGASLDDPAGDGEDLPAATSTEEEATESPALSDPAAASTMAGQSQKPSGN